MLRSDFAWPPMVSQGVGGFGWRWVCAAAAIIGQFLPGREVRRRWQCPLLRVVRARNRGAVGGALSRLGHRSRSK